MHFQRHIHNYTKLDWIIILSTSQGVKVASLVYQSGGRYPEDEVGTIQISDKFEM